MPNPSGHSMIDGPTIATDLDRTTANKALVKAFVEEVLVNGRMDTLSDYIQGENYLQHNPTIADGLSGLGTAFEALAKAGITIKYDRVHRVLGDVLHLDLLLDLAGGSVMNAAAEAVKVLGRQTPRLPETPPADALRINLIDVEPTVIVCGNWLVGDVFWVEVPAPAAPDR